MHEKFEINRTKIKGGLQLGRKGVAHNAKSDLPLINFEMSVCPLFWIEIVMEMELCGKYLFTYLSSFKVLYRHYNISFVGTHFDLF